jgi:hypothetical protein
MNQRRESRIELEKAVSVTLLTDPPLHHLATTRNASGRGLALEMPVPVDPGTAIRVEMNDCMLLGEVIHCRNGSVSYLIGVELDQVLTGLTELGKRLQEFADASLILAS